MVDTAGSGGKVTRLDVTGLDSWLNRVGRAADGISKAFDKVPEGASTVIGKDARLAGGRRLGLRHDAALYRAGEVTVDIADLVRKLRDTGRGVITGHTATDADNADGVHGTTD
ncbi:MAG: hypothetical protein ACRDTM_01545 [Micromonosporaceae bacterium]